MSERGLIVKKRNELIEGSYQMSAAEMRVVVSIIAQIHKDDEDFRPYVVSVKHLAENSELTEQAIYNEVIQVAESLMKRIITLPRPEGKKGFIKLQWLNKVEYNRGESCFTCIGYQVG